MLFTPLTQATLSKAVLNKAWLRQATGAESLIHVHLLSPSGEQAATHTLAYAGRQWLVLPGLHGKPERTYHLSPEEALIFQKRMFEALQEDSFSGWWRFANWYREWRISVSTRQ